MTLLWKSGLVFSLVPSFCWKSGTTDWKNGVAVKTSHYPGPTTRPLLLASPELHNGKFKEKLITLITQDHTLPKQDCRLHLEEVACLKIVHNVAHPEQRRPGCLSPHGSSSLLSFPVLSSEGYQLNLSFSHSGLKGEFHLATPYPLFGLDLWH